MSEVAPEEAQIPSAKPDRMDIALKLNRHFISWRDRILRRLYNQNHHGNMTTHLASEEGENEYVWEAGREESWQHSYSGVPGPRYFWRHVMPTLLEITETPEELEKAGVDAVEILQQLMTAELSYTNYHTSRGLLENFFKNVDVSRRRYHSMFAGGRSADGQFKFLYTLGKPKSRRRRKAVEDTRDELVTAVDPEKAEQLREARKWLTMAVAKRQSWECYQHRGDGDCTNHTRKIKETFFPAYRAVPLSCRGKAMKAFVRYGAKNGAMAYLDKVPEMAQVLLKEGGESFAEYYFSIMQHAPELTHDGSKGRNFPAFDSEKLVQEFRSLEGMGEYKSDALQLMEWAVTVSDWRHGISCSFQEIGEEGPTSDLHVPEIIGKLEVHGLESEEIKQVLQLPGKENWLGRNAAELLRNYPALDSNFPGGVEALMDYLEDMRGAAFSVSNILALVGGGELPQVHQAEFLQKGKELVVRLGDDAAEYFNLFRKGYFLGHVPTPLGELFESDWEAFSEKIDEVADIAGHFSHFKELGSAKAFARSLNYCLDPQFSGYKEGLLFLGEGLQRIMDEKKAEVTKGRQRHHMPDALLSVMVEHYWQAPYSVRPHSREDFGRVFPDDSPFMDHAKILLHHVEAEFSYGDTYSNYINLVHHGLDYRVAAFLAPVREGRQIVDYDWNPVEGLEEPDNKEEVLRVMRAFVQLENNFKAILEGAPRRFGGGLSGESVCHELVPSDVSELRQIEAELVKLEEGQGGVRFLKCHKLKSEIDRAIRFAFLRDIISGSVACDVDEIETDEKNFFRRTNPYTQMAIAGCSLLASVGALKIPGVRFESSQVSNVRRLLTEGQGMELGELEAGYLLCKDELSGRIRTLIPHFEKVVKEARSQMPGVMPVGGKIHTQRPMDERTLDFVHKIFGFKNTPFRLIHAGSSLLIPPMPTSLEFNMLVKILELLAVVDPQNPDIQNAMGGRWNEINAPYVGASVLLGTQRGVMYKTGAFGTTHDDQTGARIMAFDAGVKEEGMPYDIPAAEGRTDILGRHAMSDSFIYQLLGTLTTHQQFGGMFRGKMPGVQSQLDYILGRHDDLRGALFESAWVYDHAGEGDSLTAHEAMVRKFTKARMFSGQMGVKHDVQMLIGSVHRDLRAERERVIQANPEEFDRFMNY